MCATLRSLAPDRPTLYLLDELGLVAVGQRLEPDHVLLALVVVRRRAAAAAARAYRVPP